MDIGKRIRKLRMQQNRTLQEISEICGFTRSLLSKIENGKTMPPIATLTCIARALGVKVTVLLDEGFENNSTAFTQKASILPEKMTATDKGYQFFPFASSLRDKLFQPYLFVAEKGQIKNMPLSHEGEEFIYMLEGEMRYRVSDIEYILRQGDSLYFDSQDEHDLMPISDKVVYLAIFCGPSEKQKEGNDEK